MVVSWIAVSVAVGGDRILNDIKEWCRRRRAGCSVACRDEEVPAGSKPHNLPMMGAVRLS
jgi:hypothetical protein